MEKRSSALAVLLLVSCLVLTSAQDGKVDILLPSQGNGAVASKECCNSCSCTGSIHPRCRCYDEIMGGCRPNCESCYCTKSIPPQCYCRDSKNYCDPPCSLNA